MTTKTPYPSETQERYIVRFPDGMRDRIREAAEANGRSMNAEIVQRLQDSFSDQQALRLLHERRKLELLASYVEWCTKRKIDPREGFTSYAKAYKEAHELNDFSADIETVSGVTNVDHIYLSELYANWIIERPGRFPELADKQLQLERDFAIALKDEQAKMLRILLEEATKEMPDSPLARSCKRIVESGKEIDAAEKNDDIVGILNAYVSHYVLTRREASGAAPIDPSQITKKRVLEKK